MDEAIEALSTWVVEFSGIFVFFHRDVDLLRSASSSTS
jgi:hypothetical protein